MLGFFLRVGYLVVSKLDVVFVFFSLVGEIGF